MKKNKLVLALLMLAVLAVAAAVTLQDEKLRLLTLLVLGFFSAKIVVDGLRRRSEAKPGERDHERQEQQHEEQHEG